MKLLQKIAEALQVAPIQDPATRTRALSRLGPPRLAPPRERTDPAMPA
jgi:hypothetical protein